MKAIWFIVNSIVVLVMMSIVGLFLMPYLPFEHNIELRIVESGSMEPAIMTGALVVIRPTNSYTVGDVITFEDRGAKVPTTHRIVEERQENGHTVFVTKGDANEEADPRVVTSRQILGAVAFDVPRVGFVLDFARQPIGFLLLIVLPALLIVLSEIEKIWREVRARRRHEEEGEESGGPTGELAPVKATVVEAESVRKSMMDIATPVRYLNLPTLDLRHIKPYRTSVYSQQRRLPRLTAALPAIVFSVLVFSSGFLGSTVSYFNDMETSRHNLLAALALDVAAVPDGNAFSFLGTDIVGGDDSVTVDVSLEAGSALAHYDVTTEVIGTSTPLCDAINTNATLPASYNGPLSLLTAADVIFDAPWEITFSLPDESGLSSVDMCAVEIVLTAWHQDEALGDGYFDEERVPLLFAYTAPVTIESFSPLTGNDLSASIKQAVDSVASGSDSQEKAEDAPGLLEGTGDTSFEASPDGEEETDQLLDTEADEESEAEVSEDIEDDERTKEDIDIKEEENILDVVDEEQTEDEGLESSILSESSDPETEENKEEVEDESVVDEAVAEPAIEDAVE